MRCEEAERDQEANERVEYGVLEDLADEIEREVVRPRFRGRRGEIGRCGDGLHSLRKMERREQGRESKFSSPLPGIHS